MSGKCFKAVCEFKFFFRYWLISILKKISKIINVFKCSFSPDSCAATWIKDYPVFPQRLKSWIARTVGRISVNWKDPEVFWNNFLASGSSVSLTWKGLVKSVRFRIKIDIFIQSTIEIVIDIFADDIVKIMIHLFCMHLKMNTTDWVS